jgi:hypothetical protein
MYRASRTHPALTFRGIKDLRWQHQPRPACPRLPACCTNPIMLNIAIFPMIGVCVTRAGQYDPRCILPLDDAGLHKWVALSGHPHRQGACECPQHEGKVGCDDVGKHDVFLVDGPWVWLGRIQAIIYNTIGSERYWGRALRHKEEVWGSI